VWADGRLLPEVKSFEPSQELPQPFLCGRLHTPQSLGSRVGASEFSLPFPHFARPPPLHPSSASGGEC
jgi:hypothetical protein